MRTTINIDDDLYEKAARFTGIKSKTALLNMGLEALVQRYAAQELAKMGGMDPHAWAPPRQRPWTQAGKKKK